MDSSSCTVRSATEADFDGVTAIFAQENAFHVALLPDYIAVADPPTPREEYDGFLAHEERELLVAEQKGEIIGVALAAIRTAADMPFLVARSFAYVMDLAVEEAHRGSGVGHALMRAIEAWALGMGARDIELNVWDANSRAISFYEDLGYETLDRRMTKRLTDEP